MGINDKKQMIHLVGQVVTAKHVDGTEYRGILQKATDEGIYIIPIDGSCGVSDYAHANNGNPKDLDLKQAGIWCCFIPLIFIAALWCCGRPFCGPRPFCGSDPGFF